MTTQTTTNTTTPELVNKAFLIGQAYAHTLKIEEKNGKTQISGDISVQTGENEVHKVRLFSYELTKEGKENKKFKGYQTLMNEMITVSDLSNPELKEKFPEGTVATRLRVTGSIAVNEYFNDAGLQQFQNVSGDFVSRIELGQDYEPTAEFEVEGIVQNVRPELISGTDGETTGRLKVEMMAITYQAPIILEFMISEEHASYIEEYFLPNTTAMIYGYMKNFSKKTVVLKQMGFGKPKEEASYENIREFQARGGDAYEYVEDGVNPKAHSIEQIQELQAKRNVFLAKKEEEHANKAKNNNQGGSGFGGNGSGFGNTPGQSQKDVKNIGKFF